MSSGGSDTGSATSPPAGPATSPPAGPATSPPAGPPAGSVTAFSLRSRKRRDGADPIVMITAYDEPSARLVDSAGVDVILVGDSLAEEVLGHDSTLAVGVAEMAHHVAAAARARPRALLVGDLPWMSYHTTPQAAAENAATLVRAGARAVKLEGGRRRLAAIAAIVDAEIPVMGHLGLTPQSLHAVGGYRIQGRDADAALAVLEDARALAAAGCFAIVLEAVPDALAEAVTRAVTVPTIGIGAGRGCDGQVLVLNDVLGLSRRPQAKFVRRYADLAGAVISAVSRYAADVREGSFPAEAETYHSADGLREVLDRSP